MSEPPIYFRDFQQIKAREKFDEACIITKENFDDLVGKYGLDHDVKCQVERKDTKDVLCGHDHRNGFVGRQIGGKEGLIGRDCADLYFKDHKAFATQRSFVTRELAIDDLIARLHQMQQGTFSSNVDSVRDRISLLREKSKILLDDLPVDIHGRLRDLAKARNASLKIAVRFMEKIEDDRTGKIREKANWVEQPNGAVMGIEIVERAGIIELGRLISSIREAFKSIDARRELGKAKLTAQLKILELLPGCETQLAHFEKQFQLFAHPENLRNLWVLSRTQASQIGCLRLAAHAVGSSDVTDATLKSHLHQIVRSLSQANAGREVRPAL